MVLVLVTVTLSERPLLPLVNATISNNNTIPPTTQTHGSAYHVRVEVVEVVVEVAVTVLSCPNANTLQKEMNAVKTL